MEGRKCTSCGAHAEQDAAVYCGFCGAELPLPEAVGRGSLAARFAALEVHPAAAKVRSRPPVREGAKTLSLDAGHGCVLALLVLLLVTPCIYGLVALFGDREALGDVGPLTIVALIGVPIMIGIALVTLFKLPTIQAGARDAAPPGWYPVRILSISTEEVGTREHRRLTHHVTYEDPEGARSRIVTPSRRVRDLLAHDDLGLAWIEGETLVDYERVEV